MTAILILNRLPTEQETERDCQDCELATFAEDFTNASISGFVAHIEVVREGENFYITLGENGWQWQHNDQVDWYTFKILD